MLEVNGLKERPAVVNLESNFRYLKFQDLVILA